MKENTFRIDVVDALRGFAILGILLMHSYEQYNLFTHATVYNKWFLFSDNVLKDTIPFLFAGKSYAIFALLFGFTFFVQDYHQLKKGADFRGRFLWRMVLLFLWGALNSVFYTGDVLITFALLGIVLPLTARLSNKTVFLIALVFFFQPEQWFKIVYALFNPDYTIVTHAGTRFKTVLVVLKEGNIIDMLKGAYHSQLFSITWWVESGRIYQVVALFLFGMLLGRKRKFLKTRKNSRFWVKTMAAGILCFFPLAVLKSILPNFIENVVIKQQVNILLESYSSFAFFAFMVALFIIAYYHHPCISRWLFKLEPYGKMSLTMYLSQSVLGGFIFYNWGLGLAPHLSITFSVGVGIVIFFIQYTFALLWLKHHSHGPLEYIWKKLTWITRNTQC